MSGMLTFPDGASEVYKLVYKLLIGRSVVGVDAFR
jgi:hypothetical protein